MFDEVVILVSPVAQLLDRAKHRKRIESNIDENYDNNYWVKVLENTNLLNTYSQLFKILDGLEIKYNILFSSSGDFKPTSIKDISHNLEGIYKDINN